MSPHAAEPVHPSYSTLHTSYDIVQDSMTLYNAVQGSMTLTLHAAQVLTRCPTEDCDFVCDQDLQVCTLQVLQLGLMITAAWSIYSAY